jgi:outer membrane protein insertion porin family
MSTTAIVRGVLAPSLWVALASGAARGELVRPAPDARVHSVSFHFDGKHKMGEAELSPVIATTAPGSIDRLKRALAWLPFVSTPVPHYFEASEVQKDRERLHRFYRREGFIAAAIDYRVTLSKDRRDASVAFEIQEGTPLTIRHLTTLDSIGGGPFRPPPDMLAFGKEFWEKLEKQFVGDRFSEKSLGDMRQRVAEAMADHGYIRSTVTPRAKIDSLGHGADVVMLIDPGPRVRIAGVDVQGVKSVPAEHATRQLDVSAGEWYSRAAIAKGRTNLQSVSLFARSEVAVTDSGGGDNGVVVKANVTEARARLTTLEAGYVTDGAGITGQIGWTHPNFTGGARSLDALLLTQTGWWTTSDVPDKLVRVSLPLTQPYVFSPVVSLSVGPAYEYRDSRVDRSTSWSALATLVYRFNPLQSAALRYEFTYRYPQELKFLAVSSTASYNATLEPFGTSALIDSLTQPERFNIVSFFTSLGHLDNLSRPRLGISAKPRIDVTVPFLYGDLEFVRADLQATAFVPAPGRGNALSVRGALGGLWPYGRSVPEPGQPAIVDWIRLRDQVFTAGGSSDVRGYESRLLGPKFPNLVADIVDGDTLVTSSYYVPVGGLRRWTLSAELRLGLPRLPPDLAGHVFLDAGRVWTPDERFVIPGVPVEDERTLYATGAGVGYYTPVGAIRMDVGYKLNPTALDLRSPQDVVNAVRAGLPIDAAPANSKRRYHVSISLGLNF